MIEDERGWKNIKGVPQNIYIYIAKSYKIHSETIYFYRLFRTDYCTPQKINME